MPFFFQDLRRSVLGKGLISSFAGVCNDMRRREWNDTLLVAAVSFLCIGLWYFGRYFAPIWVAPLFIAVWAILGALCWLLDFNANCEDFASAIALGLFILPYSRGSSY
jgi:hypothetical protein